MEKERLRGCVAAHITFAEFVDEVYWPQMVGPCANTKRGYECDLGLRTLIALDNMEIEQIYKLNIDGMVFACPAQDAVLACWATPARWACYQLTLPRSAAPTLGGDGAELERGVVCAVIAERNRLGAPIEPLPGSCIKRICGSAL